MKRILLQNIKRKIFFSKNVILSKKKGKFLIPQKSNVIEDVQEIKILEGKKAEKEKIPPKLKEFDPLFEDTFEYEFIEDYSTIEEASDFEDTHESKFNKQTEKLEKAKSAEEYKMELDKLNRLKKNSEDLENQKDYQLEALKEKDEIIRAVNEQYINKINDEYKEKREYPYQKLETKYDGLFEESKKINKVLYPDGEEFSIRNKEYKKFMGTEIPENDYKLYNENSEEVSIDEYFDTRKPPTQKEIFKKKLIEEYYNRELLGLSEETLDYKDELKSDWVFTNQQIRDLNQKNITEIIFYKEKEYVNKKIEKMKYHELERIKRENVTNTVTEKLFETYETMEKKLAPIMKEWRFGSTTCQDINDMETYAKLSKHPRKTENEEESWQFQDAKVIMPNRNHYKNEFPTAFAYYNLIKKEGFLDPDNSTRYSAMLNCFIKTYQKFLKKENLSTSGKLIIFKYY
jgi:hypothetical protein